jgi:hypothetical protein
MDSRNNSLPKFIGEKVLSPIRLSDDQEDLCKRLDEWHNKSGLKIKPSDMFRGAIFAIRDECNSNPDCISQAANSLREILYPFQSPQVKKIHNKRVKAFEEFGSVIINESFYNDKIGPLSAKLNDIAHHGVNPKWNKYFDFSNFNKIEFQNLLREFEKVMSDALTRQLDVHKMIDEILSINPLTTDEINIQKDE